MPTLVMKYGPLAALVLAVLVALHFVRADAVAQERARIAEASLHTLSAANAALTGQVSALTDQLATTRARVDTVWRRAQVHVAQADTAGHLADSLHVVAIRQDTALVCRAIAAAYDARTSECAQLRVANAEKDTAIALGQAQIQRAVAFTGLLRDSLASQGRQLLQIAAPYTCHVTLIPGLVRLGCPSRGAAALGAAILVESLHLLLTHTP